MSKTYTHRTDRTGSKVLFCSLAAVLSLLPIYAQTPTTTASNAAGSEETVTLEAVSVTGSNIKRMDQEKVLPVTVFNTEALDARNALTPVEIITALPQVTNVPANEASTGGAGQRGDIATVNMRGIGSGGTLLLLNGRRLAAHPIINVTDYSPNVSTLPTQGLDHIDVLRDGASSIYGSDAVAGVINYITKSDFRGTELRVRYGQPEHKGGRNVDVTLTNGTDFAGGKGRVVSTFEYLYRDAIFTKDRSFSANADHTSKAPAPFNVPGSVYDGTLGTGIYPSFTIGTSTARNYFRPLAGAGSTPGFTTTAPTHATTPEYYYNVNQDDMVLPRTNRQNWFTTVEYDITPKITAFSDLSFYHSHTQLERNPLALNAPGADQVAVVSADNPFNPYGSRFYSPTGAPNADGTARLTGAPRTMSLYSRMIVEDGPEHVEVEDQVYRVVAGLRGKLWDTWTWESAALYTRGQATDRSFNAIRESLLDAALLRTDTTAYNPFGYTFKVQNGAVVVDQAYTNPTSVLKTFRDTFRHDGFSSVGSVDLRTAGQVVDIWSGPVSLAFGGEYRKEEFGDHRPAFSGLNPVETGLNPSDNDFITASPKPDSFGQRTIASGYAETVIPLVAPKNHVPLVNSLEVTGSGRFEHYSDFGNTTRPKVGLNFKPLSWIMIRTSFNEGFTAPSLPLVFYPAQFSVDTVPGTTDTYRNPVTNEGPYVQKSQTSAAKNLQPSTSIGKSIGAVVDVPVVKGLSFSADYWQIDQNQLIGQLTNAQILNDDLTKLTAYSQSVPVGQLDAGSGTANYKGSPYVIRAAPTTTDLATFATYNTAHPNAPLAPVGQIIYRIAQYQNLAKGYVSGWDLGTNYNFPTTPIGRFNFSSDWSYLIRSYTLRNVPGAGLQFQERMNVDGTTRWRGNATLSWRKGPWNASFSAYYIGKYEDSSASTTVANYTALNAPSWLGKTFDSGTYVYRNIVQDTVTYNLSVRYSFGSSSVSWLKDTAIRVGVINLWDTKPPLTSGNYGFSTSVYGQMAAGRTFTVEITKRF